MMRSSTMDIFSSHRTYFERVMLLTYHPDTYETLSCVVMPPIHRSLKQQIYICHLQICFSEYLSCGSIRRKIANFYV